jgi:hypothetical protein
MSTFGTNNFGKKRKVETDVTEWSHESSAKKKRGVLDEAFQFGQGPSWKNDKHQKVLGKTFKIISPTSKVEFQPSLVEFILKNEKNEEAVVNFTPNTRFRISGTFQKRATPIAEWESCVPADALVVIVQPNWLDNLIKRVDLFQGTKLIVYGDEGTFVAPFINTFLYNMMDKDQKKILCMESCSPGYAAPSKTGAGGWNVADNSEYRKYAETIFLGDAKTVDFSHTFFQNFPFWQHNNYFSDRFPNILPINNTLPITIRIVFNDFPDAIFKKIGEETPIAYRFAFQKFDLVTENLVLAPSFKASLMKERKMMPYQGVCRILRTENIPATVMLFKKTVQQVYFPEGILIYAIPKDVVAGVYKYRDNTDGTVLSPHNIVSVDLHFGNKEYLFSHPNIGDITDNLIERNSLIDYYTSPPFGIKMDKDKITLENIDQAWKNGNYPHVYLNLCNFMDKSRIQPNQAEDSSIMANTKDLELIMKFDTGGATANVVYATHMFYSDVNTVYDPTSKQFFSPYIKFSNQVV